MTVSDDKSNTYSIQATGTDSTNGARIFAFRALNIASGTSKLTFTPSASTEQVAPVFAEFYNIATSSADDGNANGNSASGSSTMSTGSLTTTGSNDLVFQCGFRSQTRLVNASPAYTKGSGWTLMSTDAVDGLVSQYQIKASGGSITPSLTMANNSGYVTAAIALKSASAGSPRPAGMQIIGVQHQSINPSYSGTTPLLLQFPTSGNLLVSAIGPGGASYQVTSIASSPSNTWSNAYPILGDSNSGKSQIWYAANASASTDMTISPATSGGGTNDATIVFYDVTGAATAPYRGSNSFWNQLTTDTTSVAMLASVSPGTNSGIGFGQMSVAQNTCSSITAPTGGNFNSAFAHGLSLSGRMPVDQNNCWGTYAFAANSYQNWTWGFTQDAAKQIDAWAGGVAWFGASGDTAIPYIVQQANNAIAATATTLAITVNATGSNALVIAVGNGNSRTVSKVCTDGGTCAAGHSFTQATSAAATNGTQRSDIWYCLSCTSGATTITVTYSATATNREATVWEVAGITAFDLANHTNAGTGSSNTVSSPAITTTGSLGFAAAIVTVNNIVTASPKSGNEFNAGGTIFSATTTDATASFISHSAASHQAQWSDSQAADGFGSSIAAFK